MEFNRHGALSCTPSYDRSGLLEAQQKCLAALVEAEAEASGQPTAVANAEDVAALSDTIQWLGDNL